MVSDAPVTQTERSFLSVKNLAKPPTLKKESYIFITYCSRGEVLKARLPHGRKSQEAFVITSVCIDHNTWGCRYLQNSSNRTVCVCVCVCVCARVYFCLYSSQYMGLQVFAE